MLEKASKATKFVTPPGCATRGGRSIPAALPVVFESFAVAAASKRNHSVRAAGCPEHAGAFQQGTDYGFAGSFNDSRADEQSQAAELGIAHPARITVEVVRLGSQ